MGGVRVLVGTLKGAFLITSDGGRRAGTWTGRSSAGGRCPSRPTGRPPTAPTLGVQGTDWHGQLVQRSDDGGRTWAPVGNGLRLRRRARDAPVVRRHATPVGVQPRLAPRAVADRPRHGVRAASRTPLSSARPTAAATWSELAGLRTHTTGRPLGAGRRRHGACTRSSSTPRSGADASSRSRPPGRSAATTAGRHLAAHHRGPAAPTFIPDPEAEVGHCVHNLAMPPVAPRHAVHAEALGRHAQSTTPGALDRGRAAICRATSASRSTVHAHEPGDGLRGADHERLRALSARGQAARVPQPHGRQRVGSARRTGCRSATATSTCCATRWRSTRSTSAASTSAPPAARSTRRPTPATPGRRSSATCRRCCRSRCRRSRDAEVRVVLPRHLRTLARRRRARCCVGRRGAGHRNARARRAGGELPDAARHHPRPRPRRRRPFMRFFACEEDSSNASPDDKLPDAVAAGAEPFLVVGAGRRLGELVKQGSAPPPE